MAQVSNYCCAFPVGAQRRRRRMASKYSSAFTVACAAVGGAAVGAYCAVAAKAAWSRPVKLGRRLFLGIDIGGTTISVGLVDDFGTILGAVQIGELGEDHEP